MSGNLVTTVWKSDCGDASLTLLLMALADEANDAGECVTDIPTLMCKARQSERNCRYLIRKLEEVGIVERFEARGRSHKNRYQLHLENLQNLQNLQPVHHLQVLGKVQPVQVIEEIKPAITATSAGFIEAVAVPFPSNSPTPEIQDKIQDKESPLISPQGENGAQGKRKRKDVPPVLTPLEQQVLQHLCAATGRRYRVPGEITGCLNRGTSVEECLLVIDWWAEVKIKRDPDQDQYFDYDTPFCKKHFGKYLAAAEGWERQGRPQYYTNKRHGSTPGYVDKNEARKEHHLANMEVALERTMQRERERSATVLPGPRLLGGDVQ